MQRKDVIRTSAKKKKTVIIVLVLIVIAAVIAFCVSNYSPFNPGKNLDIYSIYRYDSANEHTDITDNIDHESLCKILPTVRIQRIPFTTGPFLMEEAEYEISGFIGENHFRIYLETGKNSLCQINGKDHRLKNSESWIEILKALEKAN